jgi:hypothetical protein
MKPFCSSPQLTHLFDNEGTVLFAIFMALWGELLPDIPGGFQESSQPELFSHPDSAQVSCDISLRSLQLRSSWRSGSESVPMKSRAGNCMNGRNEGKSEE